jgi:DNA polymerase-3 subunit gamma/tau
VVTALYRRYRPETFAELIGQSQVTDPLRTALRTDRVNHAYLFSGPRGCGKTTSARILARCLNCAEGPTDTPCGKCASCIELARDGSGSLDVVEIDAASHNGVDDARDLRERAAFAPARDRYKIFILDEAHMVTTQGFNALLKLVEEPPEHVKFIFATTEPEKVIGTIRSRTHHYPFRLVPPAQMLDYVQTLSASEGVDVEPGVLPLVVRAGGGSVRDTLSLLDQLIAGSDGTTVEYGRAVALLGYTHGALLDEVVDSLAARDAGAVFAAVDRVVQTGQDPRRFVEDLLERLRDLIVVAATRDGAAAVLRGVPQDELDRMLAQSTAFGSAELSRAADVVNSALTEMTGATSPRLHLELMVARLLVPASDDTERGALARVERLERRVGIDAVATAPAGEQPAPATSSHATQEEPARPAATPATRAEAPELRPNEPPVAPAEVAAAAPVAPAAGAAPVKAPVGPVTLQQLKDSWPEILEAVQAAKRSAWMVVFTSNVRALDGDVLTLTFPSEGDVASFRQGPGSGDNVSEHLRAAIQQVLGIRVKFIARVDNEAAAPAPAGVSGGWTVASIPSEQDGSAAGPTSQAPTNPEPVEPEPSDYEAEEPELREPEPIEPAPAPERATASAKAAAPAKAPSPKAETATASARTAPEAKPRYGEAVVRELLGASFIEETSLAPRDRPVPLEPEA